MEIQVDTSKVSGVIAGSAFLEKNIYDTWYYRNIELTGGKIYGLVSEYGQGCMYLSYLLGGNVDFGELQVVMDNTSVSEKSLQSISWNLEPANGAYKNKTVRKSIEQAISQTNCQISFEDIAKKFLLTEERYDRKLKNLSGERWRASAALGFASGKKIYYAPYEPSMFYRRMKNSHLFEVLRYLADNGAIVVLPVGNDTFIKSVVDECLYLDPDYTL